MSTVEGQINSIGVQNTPSNLSNGHLASTIPLGSLNQVLVETTKVSLDPPGQSAYLKEIQESDTIAQSNSENKTNQYAQTYFITEYIIITPISNDEYDLPYTKFLSKTYFYNRQSILGVIGNLFNDMKEETPSPEHLYELTKETYKTKKIAFLSNLRYYHNSIIESKSYLLSSLSLNHFVSYYDNVFNNYKTNDSIFDLLFIWVNKEQKNEVYRNLHTDKFYEENLESNKKLISSKVMNFELFASIYNYNTNLKNNRLAFKYWRYISSNKGDSFYRCFIFSYLEQCIIEKCTDNLWSLFLDVLRLNEIDSNIFNDNQIDINRVILCFNILYDFIMAGDIIEAYKILISLFNKESDFEKGMTVYLRYCIYLYLKKCNLEQVAEDEYKMILMMNNEPSKLVFDIMPYVFNVVLQIYYFEHGMDELKFNQFKQEDKDIFYGKKIEEKKKLEVLFIHIGYFYNQYYVIYYQIDEMIYKIQDQVTNLTPFIDNKVPYKCNKCNTKTDFALVRNTNNIICIECLRELIHDAIYTRAKLFIRDRFINREYYLRPLSIFENAVFLENIDTYVIYKKNLTELLYEKVRTICFNCEEKKEENNLNELPCRCRICTKCIKYQLEDYCNEKETQREIICLYCKEILSIKTLIKFLPQDDINSITHKRTLCLKQKVRTKCLNCLKETQTTTLEGSLNVEIGKELKILSNEDDKEYIEGIEYFNGNHIICNNCYKNIIKERKRNKNETKKITIQCKICNDKKHSFMAEGISMSQSKGSYFCCGTVH